MKIYGNKSFLSIWRVVLTSFKSFFLWEHDYSEVRLLKPILICSVVQHEQLILIEFEAFAFIRA